MLCPVDSILLLSDFRIAKEKGQCHTMVHSLFEQETRKDTTGFDLVLSLIRRLLLEESEKKNPQRACAKTHTHIQTYMHAHIQFSIIKALYKREMMRTMNFIVTNTERNTRKQKHIMDCILSQMLRMLNFWLSASFIFCKTYKLRETNRLRERLIVEHLESFFFFILNQSTNSQNFEC